ncbi:MULTISPECIES: hypothetical protein [Prauserella salsuginis group]|uniref:Uncharacterized protein n=2 Tax=Prauserella salsuginis group TaxID=2893672 RepID=A0A839XQ90_9PSEU|nr:MULTISPECIES: hypothetical protein [Prauserella salsuginis group]MBB3663048.1 hypothetical protein [Prauserella sediminis]MCR3721222.1 hypothetical protein [Prauserella flava]MCR3734697.1 hypothetical protein [Prauserella salsuginis]
MSAEDTASGSTRIPREKIAVVPTLRDLALVSVLGWALQLLATDISALAAVGGMAGLYLICAGGIVLTRFAPFYLPSIAWISLLGIAATLPFTPWGSAVTALVADIDFLALSVPALAYAGLALTEREIDVVKKSGWKLLLIAVFVLASTYIGSAVVADIVLRITG